MQKKKKKRSKRATQSPSPAQPCFSTSLSVAARVTTISTVSLDTWNSRTFTCPHRPSRRRLTFLLSLDSHLVGCAWCLFSPASDRILPARLISRHGWLVSLTFSHKGNHKHAYHTERTKASRSEQQQQQHTHTYIHIYSHTHTHAHTHS
jgi:hypothetical protein